ncbi:MAG: hypothetical protein ACE5F1_07880 [Planctomycetota bacterium]
MTLAAICLLALSPLVQDSPPTGAARLLREPLRELIARARWPFPAAPDTVALFSAADVELAPPRLHLGGKLYQVGIDCMLHLPAGTPVELPFDGMEALGARRYRLELGTATLELELSGLAAARRCLAPSVPGTFGRSPFDRGEGAPAWLECCEKELRDLGYRSGPELRIEFRGLERLFDKEPSPRQIFDLIWNLLIPEFRARSARWTEDPGPGLRGREALLRRIQAAKEKRPGRARFHSDELAGLPPLGFLVRGQNGSFEASRLQRCGFDGQRFPRESAVHRLLLEKLLNGLVWPLPEPGKGAERVLRPDDGWQRSGLVASHRAIDLGSMVLLEAGTAGYWPAGTPVCAPHALADPIEIERKDGRAFLVELTQAPYLLRLLFVLYHLEERNGAMRLAAFASGTPHGWRSSEPLFRLLGLPKGNHVHIELVGLYPGAPAEQALFFALDLRTAFMRAPSGVTQAAAPRAFIAATLPAMQRPGVLLGRLLHRAAAALPRLPLRRTSGGWKLGRPVELADFGAWHRRDRHARQTVFELAIPLEAELGLLLSLRGRSLPGKESMFAAGPVRVGLERLGREFWPRMAEREFRALGERILGWVFDAERR